METAKRNRIAYLIILLACLLLMAGGCFYSRNAINYENGATSDKPLVSPDGQYQLQVVAGYNGEVHYYTFQIAKLTEPGWQNKLIYASTDIFRQMDKTVFMWDKENRVWVYTSDTGVYYWTRQSDSLWVRGLWKKDADSIQPTAEILAELP